jgi:RND superfamily putative drug exporter
MDYEVFLVSGMREHWVHHRDARGAIRHGFIAGSRVVTAAALIMIFVFASFIPEGGGTIKPIALALAVGIVFDAFLVRETFVPAAMALFGRAAWYLPRWLDRLLPVVDIEGESLTRRRSEQEWAAGQQGVLLSASALRPDVPLPSPITLEVAAGEVRAVQVPGEYRRAVVATLSGHLAQASGNLQIAGLPGPSHGAELRRIAAPVFDEGGAWRSSLGDLLAERLRYARRGSRRGTVDGWLERIRDAAVASGMAAAGEPAQFPRAAPLGAYTADERLLVLSAAALAGGATVLVVDMGDLGRESERLLTAALSALIDETCAAVLVTAPHPDLSNVLPLPNRKAVSL